MHWLYLTINLIHYHCINKFNSTKRIVQTVAQLRFILTSHSWILAWRLEQLQKPSQVLKFTTRLLDECFGLFRLSASGDFTCSNQVTRDQNIWPKERPCGKRILPHWIRRHYISWQFRQAWPLQTEATREEVLLRNWNRKWWGHQLRSVVRPSQVYRRICVVYICPKSHHPTCIGIITRFWSLPEFLREFPSLRNQLWPELLGNGWRLVSVQGFCNVL